MNKKLMIAVVAACLSVTTVSASNITGVEGVPGVGGVGNIFDIDPSQVNGSVGYRQYDDFQLSAGDIANLIYKYGTEISTLLLI